MNHLSLTTPVGDMLVATDGQDITEVRFLQDKYFPQASVFERQFGAYDAKHGLLNECKAQLNRYFNGTLQHFTLPLSPQGTAFQQSVWQAILQVNFGEAQSYAKLAHSIDKPSAVRAVGGAVGRNPIAVIIPCHRILGQSGAITGYAAGLTIKRHLLALEKIKYHE
ncbi:MAG: Methylated-DNA--protein-cysteine methyltransferase, constitutive [Pseudomonadota bacterium]|jgi:methylated-DNA-[protein]-cysteine S-methyltransferase